MRQGLTHNLIFLFREENGVAWIIVKTSNISGKMQPILFIRSPRVWKNNVILKNDYWDDLNIIDQGHNKGNVSQFCL